MKRILIIVLALAMVLGCMSFTSAEEAKKLSICTVKAGAAFPDGVDVGNSDFLLKIEELTGFDLEWTTLADGSVDTLNLLLTSGNCPDLIQFGAAEPIVDLVNKGAVACLDDALDAYGEGLLELIPEDVLGANKINGSVYFLPRYTGGISIGTIALRQDILEELGLEVPVTIEDWDEVLATVKEETDLIPYMFYTGSNADYMEFGAAFGVGMNRPTYFYVDENGECSIPMLSENGYALIEKLNEWYKAGYFEEDYAVSTDKLSRFLAGEAFAAYVNYTETARNEYALYEKVEGAKLLYVAPPTTADGEIGWQTVDSVSSMAWFVPITSADKADLAIEFLNACLDEKVLNLICYGWEGQNWEYVDGVPTFIEGAAPADYRGYYSRVVLDITWDAAWNASNGLTDHMAFLDTFYTKNPVCYIPAVGCEAYSANNPQICSEINTAVANWIVDGITEESFAEVTNKVMNELGGQQVIDQINAWMAE